MEPAWNGSESRPTSTNTAEPPAHAPIGNWVELGRAILTEASRRTTEELVARRCDKLRRAVRDVLPGGHQ